jgi:hypothetical protein
MIRKLLAKLLYLVIYLVILGLRDRGQPGSLLSLTPVVLRLFWEFEDHVVRARRRARRITVTGEVSPEYSTPVNGSGCPYYSEKFGLENK